MELVVFMVFWIFLLEYEFRIRVRVVVLVFSRVRWCRGKWWVVWWFMVVMLGCLLFGKGGEFYYVFG